MTQPRILVSYFFGPRTIPLGAACANAFAANGWAAYQFNSQVSHPLEHYAFKWLAKLARGLRLPDDYLVNGHPWSNLRYRERSMEAAIAEFRPDVLFIIRGNSVSAEFLHRVKQQYGIKRIVGWWVKDPRPNDPQLLADSKLYDHYFCIHRHGYAATDGIEYLPALGLERRPPMPTEAAPPPLRTRGIVMVGGWSQRREAFIRPLLDLPLTIVGPGWKKRGRLEPGHWSKILSSQLWGSAVDDFYRSGKIVLNITSWDPAILTGLNLRICDVPALGAFLLTDQAAEIAEFVEPGREVMTYTTPQDLRAKAMHYLEDDAGREAIALAGWRRAASDMETYEQKMARVLAIIGMAQGAT
jgi:spore maturation protein CgeB